MPAVVACALAALPAAAQAGPPGKWTKITGLEVPAHNTDEVGLSRTADGVLHVAYSVAPGSGAPESVMHRAISKDAKTVSGPDTVATLKTMNNSVALVGGPGGGLRAFFAGLTDETGSGFLRTATSDASGKVWSAAAPASNTGLSPHQAYVGAGISAVLRVSGDPVSIWGDSSPGGGALHDGLDPTVEDVNLGDSDCCQVDPALARDAGTGNVWAAWYHIDPDRTDVTRLGGSTPSAILSAPNGAAGQLQDRVGLTGRLDGKPGVYLAYTTGTNQFSGRPALWKVGSAKPLLIPGQKGGENIGIAPAPGGRLWLFWSRDGHVWITRTNPDATKFGAIVKRTPPPPGRSTIYRLIGEASLGTLDLLGLFERGSSDLGYSHERMLPGLSLTGPAKVKAGKTIVLRVLDAGDPVAGAKVKLGASPTAPSGTTNASGRVTFTIPAKSPTSKRKARATKAGYFDGTLIFQVKKKK
jgi:hypothetical protein